MLRSTIYPNGFAFNRIGSQRHQQIKSRGVILSFSFSKSTLLVLSAHLSSTPHIQYWDESNRSLYYFKHQIENDMLLRYVMLIVVNISLQKEPFNIFRARGMPIQQSPNKEAELNATETTVFALTPISRLESFSISGDMILNKARRWYFHVAVPSSPRYCFEMSNVPRLSNKKILRQLKNDFLRLSLPELPESSAT